MLASTTACTFAGSSPRAAATMSTWARAAATLMSGSKLVKSPVARSMGMGVVVAPVLRQSWVGSVAAAWSWAAVKGPLVSMPTQWRYWA